MPRILFTAFLLATTLGAGRVFADTAANPSPETGAPAICAKTACRKGGFEVAVSVDDKRYTTVPVTRSPYVPDDESLLIFPGETFAVQFSVDGDKLNNPKFYRLFAPRLPAQIAKDDALSPNPDDAALPVLEKGLPTKEVAELPPNTILISYGELGRSIGMTLQIEHNLPHTLKLDAIMAIIKPGAYDQHRTSTCPIPPKLIGMEYWPQPLGPMVLTHLRFLADSDKMVCD